MVQVPERIRPSVVKFATRARRIHHSSNLLGSVHEDIRFRQAEAIGQLTGTKDQLFDPWVRTCLTVWGLNPTRGDRYDESALHLEDCAQRSLRSVLLRGWEVVEPAAFHGSTTVDGAKKYIETPRPLQYTTEQAKITKYLGFDNETEFLSGIGGVIEGQIRNLMAGSTETEQTLEALRPVYAFAESAYNTRKPRKSGEGYYCHALRVLYYTLDHLTRSGTIITSPRDMVDILTACLLHDAIEDVRGLTVLPFATRKDKDEPAVIPRSRRDYTYVLTTPNPEKTEGNDLPSVLTRRLRVSEKAHGCIKAMTSPEVETDGDKFMHVVHSSPWSITEIIKNMDRLDNVLTYRFTAKSWWQYLYKMYESSTGMARLSTGSEALHLIDEDIPRRLHNLGSRQKDKLTFDRKPPGEYVAFGMMLHALSHIRTEMIEEMARNYGTYLRQDGLIQQKPEGSYTLDDEQVPDISILFDRLNEARETNPTTILTMQDISQYEDEVKDHLSNTVYYGPRRPGYGAHIYSRKKTPHDRKVQAALRYLNTATFVGTGSIGIGLLAGVALNQFAQGPNPGLFALIELACGLTAGAGVGRVIGSKIYGRELDRLI